MDIRKAGTTTLQQFGVIFIALLFSVYATAQEHDESHAPYHLSVLVADTHIDGEGNNPTAGIDFEYRASQLLGLGAVLEYASGKLDATTALAVADIHLHEGWVTQIGPGFERRHGEEVFVSRIGVLYEFERDGFTFSPQLHWDYHDGEENAFVAGFAFGFGF